MKPDLENRSYTARAEHKLGDSVLSTSYDLGKWALLNPVINRSRVGILPARNKHETGKMPVPPRCPFYLTLKIIPLFSNAGKCTQDNGLSTQNSALNPVINRSRVGILPARNKHETGKMPVPPRCPFYLTLKIIPLFSNAGKCTQDNGLSTQNSALSLLKRLLIATTVLLAVVPTTTSCSLLERQPGSNSTLVYKGPVRQEVKAGSLIPGTDIRYISRTEDKTAEVLINGQRAFKRSGDSLDWTGSPLRGVEMGLNQRVLVYSEERLQAGGTVRLTVDGVSSKPGWVPQVPDKTNSSLVVYKVPVLYRVKQGEKIPGTTLSYTGKTEKGAQLGGLPTGESPYRQGGDSISWQGQLRPRVYLDLVVRTAFYNEDRLSVTGLATVILAIGG